MKFKHLYAGSWVPRTYLHLSEFEYFLKKGESHLSLNEEKLKKLKNNFKIEKIESDYNKYQKINVVEKNIKFSYHENGLIILKKEAVNLEKDIKKISDFSLEKLFPAFSYLYSLGAPIPKIFTSIFSIMPFILTISGATKKDVDNLFEKQKNKCVEIINNNECQIYIGEELIIINNPDDDNKLIENLIFIEDINTQFSKILDLHRFIWEEIEKIKAKKNIPYKKISGVRDNLMGLNNEIIFFNSRLKQIEHLLNEQSEKYSFEEKNLIDQFLKNKYKSLKNTADYLENLWKMTEDNAKNTLGLITMLYQESNQKELNTLQILFIVSAMASLIALGSIHGFNFEVANEAGNIIYSGKSTSFALKDFFKYSGLAILGGSIFYVIFNILYNKITSLKIKTPRETENKEIEKIKKMFK